MNELDSITRKPCCVQIAGAKETHGKKVWQGKGSHLLIADDHAIFAEALRVYLEKTHTVVGLVRDGHAMVG